MHGKAASFTANHSLVVKVLDEDVGGHMWAPSGPPESVPSARFCSLSLRYRLFALQEVLQTEPFLTFMTGCLEVKIDLCAVLYDAPAELIRTEFVIKCATMGKYRHLL